MVNNLILIGKLAGMNRRQMKTSRKAQVVLSACVNSFCGVASVLVGGEGCGFLHMWGIEGVV